MSKKPRRWPHDHDSSGEDTFWDMQCEIKSLTWTELSEEDQHEFKDELNTKKFRSHVERLERLRQFKIRRAFLLSATAIRNDLSLLSWLSENQELKLILNEIFSGLPEVQPATLQDCGLARAEKHLMQAIENLESQPELLEFVDHHGLKARVLKAFEALDESEHPASMESELRRERAYARAAKRTIEALYQKESWDYLGKNNYIAELEMALFGPKEKIDGMYDRPSIIVVDKIGDLESSEGRQLEKQYGHLCKPVPLASLNVDIETFKMALSLEFPSFLPVIEQVFSELRLRKNSGADSIRFRPLLLVGPPGVGKTRFAQKLARLLGTGYGAISAAGADDARILLGTSRGWGNRLPSFPILTIARTNFANPVIVVDEIDKTSARSHHGRLVDVLLPFLETQSAKEHPDDCLLARCDLSYISWILTANDLNNIPAPLLSRCSIHVIERTAHDPDRLYNQICHDIAFELGVQFESLPKLAPEVEGALKEAISEGTSIRKLKKLIVTFMGEDENLPKLLN